MIRDLRQILHSAYTLIRSAEVNKATNAITLEHMIQEHLDGLQGNTRQLLDAKGNPVGNRASKLDRLERLKTDLQAIIDAATTAGDDPDALAQIGLDDGISK